MMTMTAVSAVAAMTVVTVMAVVAAAMGASSNWMNIYWPAWVFHRRTTTPGSADHVSERLPAPYLLIYLF